MAELRQARDPGLAAQQLAFHQLFRPDRERLLACLLLHYPELLSAAVRHCISAILRLLYLPPDCAALFTRGHAKDRRLDIEQFGKFLGMYCGQRQQLTLLSQRTLDFGFLIELAATSGTLDVLSVFVCQFVQTLSAAAGIFPASNGFTIVLLRKLERAVSERFFDFRADTPKPRAAKLTKDEIQ